MVKFDFEFDHRYRHLHTPHACHPQAQHVHRLESWTRCSLLHGLLHLSHYSTTHGYTEPITQNKRTNVRIRPSQSVELHRSRYRRYLRMSHQSTEKHRLLMAQEMEKFERHIRAIPTLW